jgi:hypothetical protein
MFGQLYEGLVAVPNQFWGDLVYAKYFNFSLSIGQNVDVSIFIISL